uniref:BZIP domain-containing protein n=1 Tax=Panagrolaimus davidi TaxID=227884 RepID=A0A914QPM9_9BILA
MAASYYKQYFPVPQTTSSLPTSSFVDQNNQTAIVNIENSSGSSSGKAAKIDARKRKRDADNEAQKRLRLYNLQVAEYYKQNDQLISSLFLDSLNGASHEYIVQQIMLKYKRLPLKIRYNGKNVSDNTNITIITTNSCITVTSTSTSTTVFSNYDHEIPTTTVQINSYQPIDVSEYEQNTNVIRTSNTTELKSSWLCYPSNDTVDSISKSTTNSVTLDNQVEDLGSKKETDASSTVDDTGDETFWDEYFKKNPLPLEESSNASTNFLADIQKNTTFCSIESSSVVETNNIASQRKPASLCEEQLNLEDYSLSYVVPSEKKRKRIVKFEKHFTPGVPCSATTTNTLRIRSKSHSQTTLNENVLNNKPIISNTYVDGEEDVGKMEANFKENDNLVDKIVQCYYQTHNYSEFIAKLFKEYTYGI